MGMKTIIAAALSAAAVTVSGGVLAEGRLETPKDGTTISGKAIFSGWHCDATTIEIELPSGQKLLAASGTQRGDVNSTCGKSDVGFGLLFNMATLGAGEHTVKAYADGVEFAESTFTVTALSEGEFLTGKTGTATVSNFPTAGHSVTLAWEQTLQNFVITEEIIPGAGTGAVLDDGLVASEWNNGIGAFDAAIGYATCFNDNGEGCPSVSWAGRARNGHRSRGIGRRGRVWRVGRHTRQPAAATQPSATRLSYVARATASSRQPRKQTVLNAQTIVPASTALLQDHHHR